MAPQPRDTLSSRRGKLPMRSSPRKRPDIAPEGTEDDAWERLNNKRNILIGNDDRTVGNLRRRTGWQSQRSLWPRTDGESSRPVTRTSPRRAKSVVHNEAAQPTPPHTAQQPQPNAQSINSEGGILAKEGDKRVGRGISGRGRAKVLPSRRSPRIRASEKRGAKEVGFVCLTDEDNPMHEENENNTEDTTHGGVETEAPTEETENGNEETENGNEETENGIEETENGNEENEGVAMGTRKFVKRQKSRGLDTLSNKQRKDKLDIKIPPHIMRAIGPNSEKLSTEIGILVRHIPPVRVEKWSQIPYEPYIASMLGHLQRTFKFEDDDHINAAILAEMMRLFRAYRYRLHKHFISFATTEDALAHPPPDIKEDDWAYLVERFSSEKFQKRSAINKRNRGAQRTNHCGGSKSFARIRYELGDAETGELLGRKKLWLETHFSKKKKIWIDEKSKEVYDKLNELEDETQGELQEDEIFDRVLPPKSGYIRGIGEGPKPLTSRSTRKEQALRAETE